ncbi:MAG: RHS repeat-associated core domain-containing protein [Bacteroidales bacterium]|nr:RHS repeat-associated core domain-containing protein [Bacteroidales bacterium]
MPLNKIKYNEQRDEETGYGYFGARYMDHELMTMWLSVDPMMDKYPNISPYNYCMWNPVKLIDPDGREVYITGDAAEQATSQLSSKGIKVSRDERTGKLSYTKTGEELTTSDNQLIAAIDSKDVKVNVNATNAIKVPFEDILVDNSVLTGQFQGVIVSDCDNRTANTQQLVNPATCEQRDKKCKVLLGTSMRHEITESYQAGLICIDEGVSCGPSWSEFNGFTIKESGKKTVYRRAHERATKQATDILKDRVRHKRSQAKANARARAEMNARLTQNNNTLFP